MYLSCRIRFINRVFKCLIYFCILAKWFLSSNQISFDWIFMQMLLRSMLNYTANSKWMNMHKKWSLNEFLFTLDLWALYLVSASCHVNVFTIVTLFLSGLRNFNEWIRCTFVYYTHTHTIWLIHYSDCHFIIHLFDGYHVMRLFIACIKF